MLRVILMMLLSVVSSSAMAEWTPFDTGTSTEYVDLESIQKSGSRVKIWFLTNFEEPIEAGSLKVSSMKHQVEFDCEERQIRGLYMSFHSGRMGEGGIVDQTLKVGEWMPIVPSSVNSVEAKIACGKK